MNFFDALVADNERRALRAELPPYVTDAVTPVPGMLAIGNSWSMRLFDGPFYITPASAARPACSLVFVQSADGNTGARDPGTLGGGETDKHLIYEGLSRVAADAVLAGAETVRGSKMFLSVWHPELVALRASLGKPRHPAQIVATLEGLDLEAGVMFNVPHVPAVLLTVPPVAASMTRSLRDRPWITVVMMDRPEDLCGAFQRLRSMGIGTISCIGGRTLARQLLDARLVDDLYLTTAPRPGGEPGTPLHEKPWRGDLVVRKRGTRVEAGVVFEHVHAPSV